MTKTRVILLDLLGLLVIALIVAGIWISYKKHPSSKGTPSVGVKTNISKEQIQASIPQGLMVDSTATIVSSEAINYPTQLVYTMKLNSKLSQREIYQLYKAYLYENKYKIENDTTINVPVFSLYATKDNSVLSIGVGNNEDGKTTDVIINYTVSNK